MARSTSNRKQRGRAKSSVLLNRNALWAALVFALLGAGLALYSTNMTFQIATQGVVEASGCSLNDLVNCDVAAASSYANLFGIPVAWWGFLFYVFAALGALLGATGSKGSGAAPLVATGLLLSFGAVLFTFVKAYHLYQLGVVCLVCIGMYIANFGTAISLGLGIGYAPQRWGTFVRDYIQAGTGNRAGLGFDPSLAMTAVAVLVVFGIGYAGALNYQKDITGTNNFNMSSALEAHFRQTPRDIQIPEEAAVWGNPEADIVLVEFADFQCPACRVSAFHLRPALFEYRNDVQLRFMNFPLDMHQHAEVAARAGVCAAREVDFWEFHDRIFEDQVQLNPRLVTRIAEEMGLEPRPFAECVVSQEVGERVMSDRDHGREIGVTGTPSLYINGRKVAYWNNTAFIHEVIKRERG
ncbi:MAG: hypothetical protein COV99_00110 [Bacteroidetes bacterium CG12_big_fil_rev_8_21_14_0_65_60_17]|nr:MAG: hypothetical protein COV99_00110 [Bacteroidetes bacterium CG12_big_fil_rev_8_21_14_0_65_60_17]